MATDDGKEESAAGLLIAIDQGGRGGLTKEGVVDDAIRLSGDKLSAISDAIVTTGTLLYDDIRKRMESVKAIKLEFAVGVKGKAGIPYITEASAEGSFKITLEWGK